MTTTPIDHERFARLAAIALERHRSRALPRALPPAPISIARPAVVMNRLSPTDGAVAAASFRISERSARVSQAVAAERARMDEARNALSRETRPVEVASPYGKEYSDELGIRHNRPDKVERVVDTIEDLLRKRWIDRGQEAAARRIEKAWALAPGSLRCALAPGAGGGSDRTASPTEGQLWAGEVLNDVRAALGELDSPVVIRVCGVGLSIEEVARIVYSTPSIRKVPEHERKFVGMRLRMGLAHLAKRWELGEHAPGKIVGVKGAKAGKKNTQNFGELSEAERERSQPLRFAAEERARKLKGRSRKRKPKTTSSEKSN
jgi:hypothetical protein